MSSSLLLLQRLGIFLFLISMVASNTTPRPVPVPVQHDSNFVPDIVLRVDVATIQLNCQPRLSTLINGTYPAPPIYLEPERTTWIRVYNDAYFNTTMHWHGLSLSTAPYADGTPQASQWPIPPGHFFDYELHPSAAEAGTSFYHSHVGFQAITASGPLIVKDASPLPYAYDDEIILKIGDLYPQDDKTIETELTSIPFRWIGDPSALLVNGQSGTTMSVSQTTTSNNVNSTESGPDTSCQPWVMNVLPEKTYRIRLIGATTISLVLFGFEDHDNLTIIETDSAYVSPVQTDHMQVDTGQRFSFMLPTKSREELAARNKSTFWIQFETRQDDRVVSAWALLNYTLDASASHPSDSDSDQYSPPAAPATPSSIPSSSVVSLPNNVTSWMEYTFINPPFAGYDSPPLSSEVTRRVIISTLQLLNTTTQNTLMVSNNASWFDGPPLGPSVHVPYLVEILQNGTINGGVPDYDGAIGSDSNNSNSNSNSNSTSSTFPFEGSGFDPLTNTYPARIGEVIEIVWQNAASSPARVFGAHPMHAHGGHYWDMGSGEGEYSPSVHAEMLRANSVVVDAPDDGENSSTPWSSQQIIVPYPGSRRDTTLLYKYASLGTYPGELNGWRVWRVRVTERNVGVWMMHCHILQHIIMGQQTVWLFGTPEEIRQHVEPVQGSLDGYFNFGGDVVGRTGSGYDGQQEGGEEWHHGNDTVWGVGSKPDGKGTVKGQKMNKPNGKGRVKKKGEAGWKQGSKDEAIEVMQFFE
ncbi:Multicopper oxidase aurL2 [Exophiala dermatitidis]